MRFFNLEDLRRYGGNMDLLKSSGERLSGMKYFTVGQEAEVVDVGPTVQVDVAIGPERQGAPKMSSEAVKGSEETLTHWANVPLPFAHAGAHRLARRGSLGRIRDR